MTLVERFIQITNSPASRKAAVLTGLTVPIAFLNWGIMHAAFASAPMAALHQLDQIHLFGIVVVITGLAVSLLAIRLGHEGRWIPYFIALGFGLYLAAMVYSLGLWSSIAIAIVPLTGAVVALLFGDRVGWFVFIYSLILFAGIVALQAAGVLPYATGLMDRGVNATQPFAWIVGTVIPVLLAYIFTFALVLLTVQARNVQDVRLREAQALIRRYVPSQLAEKIIRGEHSTMFKPERAKLTIFFSDVEGFTDASDQLDPEDLSSVLNEYLSEMAAIAERHGATINQFVGDGIMIFFGAPQFTNDKDHALRAVRMAVEMQNRMLELKDIWVKRGIQKPFRTRIGINTGHASVGDYGSEGRKVYSAIGVQTNVAARIQAQCEPGKILISHATWALISEDIHCIDKGELQLKGVHYAVRVHEVVQ